MPSDSSSAPCSSLETTRRDLEKWQLLHTIQILKLELSQKDAILDSMRSEHLQKKDELEEELSELQCDHNLLAQRLKALSKVYEDEIQDLRKQLEEKHRHSFSPPRPPPPPVSDTANEEYILTLLSKPLLTDELYREISGKDANNISELIQIRLYEITHMFVKETEWLKKEYQRLKTNEEEEEREKAVMTKKLEELMLEMADMQSQCEELLLEKAQLISFKQHSHYKSEHYDTVKSERDALEKELDVIRQTSMKREFKEKALAEEKEKLQAELLSAQQSLSLIKQDKEYLSKERCDLSHRVRENEEKVETLLCRLNDCKQSKEEIYEQMVKQRQEQKDDYESRLQHELESLRLRTNSEMDQLKAQTREMYERENQALRQARDSAFAERERAMEKQRELEEKYEHIHNELRKFQVSSDGCVTDLNSQLQLKTFELERVGLLYEETAQSLRKSEREKEQLREKLDVLSSKSEITINELQSLVKDLEYKFKETKNRLEGYEQLETELDDVVLQAAKIEGDADGVEHVLYSYGFGTSVPSSSRRRMQQSVQLARRVLKLERINASLRQQLGTQEKEKNTLNGELTQMKSQFELSSQPHKYLMETLQGRDKKIEKLTETNATLEKRISVLEKKLKQVIEEKNKLSLDLERLLSHQEEVSIIKNLVASIGRGGGEGYSSSQVRPPPHRKCYPPPLTSQPQPTIFTRPDPLAGINIKNKENHRR
ncbi:PREDICTED: progesterone-induced-blocking factor 1-like [Amphimedon queenslandica]|nr:PREDICTED: progesterone-induced-blocking factor 1-like [Amphimedon queenslandica]|eukprot:XP_019852664.1 PREDICTED: progesterone-induced-blocking factor 1-like [Amphimedon queenslandica]